MTIKLEDPIATAGLSRSLKDVLHIMERIGKAGGRSPDAKRSDETTHAHAANARNTNTAALACDPGP